MGQQVEKKRDKYDLAVARAMGRAVMRLPDAWRLDIQIGHGTLQPVLYNPAGEEVGGEDHCECLTDRIVELIGMARHMENFGVQD